MTNPEVPSNSGDDTTRSIRRILRSILHRHEAGEALRSMPPRHEAGEVPDIPHVEASASLEPLRRRGVDVAMARQPDGHEVPESITFRRWSDAGETHPSMEWEAIIIAMGEYARRMHATTNNQLIAPASGETVYSFLTAKADQREQYEQYDRYGDMLRRLGFATVWSTPDQTVPDERVTVQGEDAALVYEAMTLGMRLIAERESKGDRPAH